jgi:succinate dehydrogenase / fumarate reductase, cytochrome b subunit
VLRNKCFDFPQFNPTLLISSRHFPADTPMAALDRPVVRPRPVYLNLLAIRLPLPAFVSILHRASGILLFLAGIPLLLWTVQGALVSAAAWARIQAIALHPLGKLVLVVMAWAYLHHFIAGIRHLVMDLHIGGTLPAARRSAAITLVLSLLLTLGVAIRLW